MAGGPKEDKAAEKAEKAMEKAAAAKAKAAEKAAAKAAAKASPPAPKESAPESIGAIPFKKPRLEEPNAETSGAAASNAAGTVGAQCPQLPNIPQKPTVNARPVMVELIPWTQNNLKEFLKKHPAKFAGFSDIEIYKHQPLEIKDTSQSANQLSSYKAPWNSKTAAQSLLSTQMYEAAGNVSWVCAFPASKTHEIMAGDPVTWGSVCDVEENFFSRAASQGRTEWHGGVIERIVFPITLPVHADDGVNMNVEFFNAGLTLVSGHAYVFSWWFAMFTALRSESVDWVASLLQCGLTVTLHLRVNLCQTKLLAWSCQQSDAHKVAERYVSDSFPAFAQKVLGIVPKGSETIRMKKLQELGVRFKGSPVNKSMMATILLFEDKIDDDCIDALRGIEAIAGRDTLTAGYSKLHRLVALCSKEADSLSQPCNELVLYMLQYIRFAIKFEQIQPRKVTVDWLDKAKDGTPGQVQVVLARKVVFAWLSSLVEDLRSADVAPSILTELDTVLPYFQSPDEYEAQFQSGTATSGNDKEIDQTDLLETTKNKFSNKLTHMILDFGYDLLAGSLDDALRKGLTNKNSLNEVSWAQLADMAALREITRALNLHQSVVHVGEQHAPQASTRTLTRYTSDGGEDEKEDRAAHMLKERQDTWHQAQLQRKKFVTVGGAKCATKAQAQTFFEKTSVYQFTGRVGEQHRVFLFSAELYHECRNTPWSTLTEFQQSATPILEFMLSQTGPCDVLVFFDGRSRHWRRELEKLTDKARHLTELWLIFQHTPRLGRKVSFGSDNRETALLSMPVSRTLLPCKDRAEYVAAGEKSTHDTSYTGVEPMPWQAMPLVSHADKTQIMGFEGTLPNAKLFDTSMGSPLFWQERKPTKFWKAFLAHLDAKAVFDCTPGAGTCGRAAMELGIQYTCMAKNAEHNSWLQNVFDRQAVFVMTQNGSPLFEQDLATCINEHFKDVLDAVHQQDACKDMSPDDDDDV